MEISFRERKLEKLCGNERELRRRFGSQAEKLSQRLHELSAAETLMDIEKLPPARLHLLEKEYKGCFAVDIKQPFRIIFRPLDGDGVDCKTITKIQIVAIRDYH